MVDNRGSSAVFEIRLPCDAPWVEIQVAGARVFLKEGERATPAGSLGSSSLLPSIPRDAEVSQAIGLAGSSFTTTASRENCGTMNRREP